MFTFASNCVSRRVCPRQCPAVCAGQCFGNTGPTQSVLVASYSIGIDSRPAGPERMPGPGSLQLDIDSRPGGSGGVLGAVTCDVAELVQVIYDIVLV